MVQSCSVPSCRNRHQRGVSLGFYRYPKKNPVLLNQWLVAIKRQNWMPGQYAVVCSEHFTKDCFRVYQTGLRHLREDAVPTIFNNPCKNFKRNINQISERVDHQYYTNLSESSKENNDCNNDSSVDNDIHIEIIDLDEYKPIPATQSNNDCINLGTANNDRNLKRVFANNVIEAKHGDKVCRRVVIRKLNESEIKEKTSEKSEKSVREDVVEVRGGYRASATSVNRDHEYAGKENQDEHPEKLLILSSLLKGNPGKDVVDIDDWNKVSYGRLIKSVTKENTTKDTDKIMIANVRKDKSNNNIDSAKSIIKKRAASKTFHSNNHHNYAASVNKGVVTSEQPTHSLVSVDHNDNNNAASINTGLGTSGLPTGPTPQVSVVKSGLSTRPHVSVEHTYSKPSINSFQLLKRIKRAKEQNKIMFNQLRSARKKLVTSERKVEKLKAMVIAQKDIERAIHRRAIGLIEDALGPDTVGSMIMQSCIERRQVMYSENIKSWASSLNSHSSKAYDIVRATFKNCLPHTSTLRKWKADEERLTSDEPLNPIVVEPINVDPEAGTHWVDEHGTVIDFPSFPSSDTED